jgi:hypothetical protein
MSTHIAATTLITIAVAPTAMLREKEGNDKELKEFKEIVRV